MRKLPTRHSVLDEFFNEVTPGFFMRPLHGGTLPSTEQIKTDVNEKDNKFYIHAEIPGASKESIDLEITDNTITINAEIKQHDEHQEHSNNLHSERYYGFVSRSFQLPNKISVNEAEASYENGILNLVLPKQVTTQSLKLEIK